MPSYHNGKAYSINSYAFTLVTSINSVVIPDEVVSIKERAFDNCTIVTVTVGDGVGSLDKNAFYSCTLMSTLTIGNATSIGESAFAFCLELTNLQYNGTASDWEQHTKSDNWNQYSHLKTVTCSDEVIYLTE